MVIRSGSHMMEKPTVKMKKRTSIFVFIFMMVAALFVIGRLFYLTVVDNKFYQDKANAYQFGEIKVSANRGSIYDANGVILAQSATVFKIFLDPSLFNKEIQAVGDHAEGALSPEGEALRSEVTKFLSDKLGVPEAKLEKSMSNTDSQYEVLKTQVEKPIADEIVAFMEEKELNSVQIQQDTKRYYPQDELAASVIGFTNSDGDGQYGVEYQYNDYLSGTDGKVISAKDANGNEMPYRYAKTYDAQNGDSVYLTIDRTLQYTLEKNLEETISQFKVEDRACGIIMNVKTGAVLAMATAPGFDLNKPSDVADQQIAQMAQDMELFPKEQLDANTFVSEDMSGELLKSLSEEKYDDAYAAAREKQWKNKAITELYIPGSVFKVITSSGALEEKVISVNDTFNCTGQVVIYEGIPPIHCWNQSGHGLQTFTEAITNSCNPAFMEIGARMGAEMFFNYFKSFGLTERTGIDLPAEATSYYQNLSGMGALELASCSFGQTNKLTPIEMITAYAAVVNGGELVTPYVVSKIVDNDGNVVLTNEKTVKRQVISAETSKLMCETLETVSDQNGAYIKGYHVGGKSGTSEKNDMYAGTDEDPMRYVASYGCFAPADDPEIILLIMVDEPMSGEYYGSQIAVPCCRKVMEEILPYMGFYPEYTDEEAKNLDVIVPLVEDLTVQEAMQEIEAKELTCEVVGDGTKVTGQMPVTGSTVASGGIVILYTDKSETQYTEVPDLTGSTVGDANYILAASGLNMLAEGASTDNGSAVVMNQSTAAGTSVPRGTVIELTFGVNDQSG